MEMCDLKQNRVVSVNSGLLFSICSESMLSVNIALYIHARRKKNKIFPPKLFYQDVSTLCKTLCVVVAPGIFPSSTKRKPVPVYRFYFFQFCLIFPHVPLLRQWQCKAAFFLQSYWYQKRLLFCFFSLHTTFTPAIIHFVFTVLVY